MSDPAPTVGVDSGSDQRVSQSFSIPTAGGNAVLVEISGTLADSIYRCTGCGVEDRHVSGLEILARAGTHAASCGRGALVTDFEEEIAAARAELARVDPKAGGYQQQAGVLAGAGLAVLTGTGAALPPAAVVVGAVTAVVVLTAVALLARASQPDLSGGFGFVSYAAADDAEALLARLTRSGQTQLTPLHRARELHWLSRALCRKYLSIRRAVPLVLAGYIGAAVTAALALWGG